MALQEALLRMSTASLKYKFTLNRLAALDHSNICVSVLEHNFPVPDHASTDRGLPRKRRRPQSFDIQRLTLQQVHDWNADVWCMSPPCQPHTRQHDKQDLDVIDPRSQSFLHLCLLLQDMHDDMLPRLLLMENVVGFETSGSCQRWREVLKDRNYKVAHFHLSPTQVGLPNDRPRYFCVAIRTTHTDEGTSTVPARSADNWEQSIFSVETNPSDSSKGPLIQTELLELDIQAQDSVGDLPVIATFIDAANDKDETLLVPSKLLASDSAWCFDWVTPSDTRTACFTQSYGRFVRGTGSVLYMGPPDARLDLKAPTDRKFHASWKEGLPPLQGYVRYFSGREIANLLGFVEGFSFPIDCTHKQQWRLLGNSLNVRVAARLCELGLRAKWAGNC